MSFSRNLRALARGVGRPTRTVKVAHSPEGRVITASGAVAGVGLSVSGMPTRASRRERRAYIRELEKLNKRAADAWEEVTEGDGVLLVDGEPYKANKAGGGA